MSGGGHAVSLADAIADASGVSETTVLRTVPANAGTQPDTVAGKDGMTYQAIADASGVGATTVKRAVSPNGQTQPDTEQAAKAVG